jgi:hypothetical protein
MTELGEHDLFGRVFFRCDGPPSFATYYRSVDAVRPLLCSQEWAASVTGWYLNCIQYGARLSYFTTAPETVIQVVEGFIAATSGTVDEHCPREDPRRTMIAADCGGEELRFRRFLSSYSPVGLDLMQADLLHARCLCITLRCQLFPERRPFRPHLEPTMLRESPVYAAFSPLRREQFWADFQHWPNPRQFDWAHFFVNMVLGFDCSESFCRNFPRARTLVEINQTLTQHNAGFQVPEGWQP